MDKFLNGSSLSFSRSFLAVAVSLAIIFAAVARDYLLRYAVSASDAIGIYSAFTLLLILSLAPAWQSSRRAMQTAARYQPLLVFVPIWCTPYFLYAAGTGDFRWTALLKLLTIAALPVAIYRRFPPRKADAFGWQDACVAVLLVGFVLSGQLRGIWNVPTSLAFMSRLFLITVASPFPNWRYVALASVAGWFYGSAYRNSGSLMASSLVHATVDTVWRTWLSAR